MSGSHDAWLVGLTRISVHAMQSVVSLVWGETDRGQAIIHDPKSAVFLFVCGGGHFISCGPERTVAGT